MYKIIGADGREYGPITAEQIRQWIAEGRANAQTRAQREGSNEWKSLSAFTEFAALLAPPLAGAIPPRLTSSPTPVVQTDDTLAALIPYKNAAALTAYYLAVFSLVPCFGFFLGIAAVIFGIVGLRRARTHPEAKGKVHAHIGIWLGGFMVLAHLVAIGLIVHYSR